MRPLVLALALSVGSASALLVATDAHADVVVDTPPADTDEATDEPKGCDCAAASVTPASLASLGLGAWLVLGLRRRR